jgi:hypothetical protein
VTNSTIIAASLEILHRQFAEVLVACRVDDARPRRNAGEGGSKLGQRMPRSTGPIAAPSGIVRKISPKLRNEAYEAAFDLL